VETIDPARIRYFSEGGEDFLLWSLFKYKSNGSFIDVGAFDGYYLSNSLSFARAGWRGVCVEPTSEYVSLCHENQPNSVCVEAACVGDPAVETVRFNSEPLGVYSRIEVAAGARQKLKNSYQRYGAEPQDFVEVEVPATTVSNLIDKHLDGVAPDFLSIDVEGGEVSVLEGVDFTRHRPLIIVAEANDEASRDALAHYLTERSYSLIRSVGNNYFFSHDAELIRLGRRAKIQCTIERHYHPKGLQYTFRGIALGKVIDEVTQKELAALRTKARQQEHLMRHAEQLEKRLDRMSTRLKTERAETEQLQGELNRAARSKVRYGERLTELGSLLTECISRRDQLTRALAKDRVALGEAGKSLEAAEASLSNANQKLAEVEAHVKRHILVPNPFRRKSGKT